MVLITRAGNVKTQFIPRAEGFTYLGLIFIVALIGVTLAMAGTLWSFAKQRETERQLLFIGDQFRQAIGRYYERTPGTVKLYPQSLKDLTLDNRYVSTQRYLRRIYSDPITGEKDWGILIAPTGGIMGVYSKSTLMPIKVGQFKYADRLFENAKHYSDWAFVYIPSTQINSNTALRR
jgi:type II secretory pathway pseudopilin PulG